MTTQEQATSLGLSDEVINQAQAAGVNLQQLLALLPLLLKLFGHSKEQQAAELGVHPEVIKAALASGLDIGVLLQLLMTYGPAVLQLLAQLFHWNLPPLPTPPFPPLPLPPSLKA